MNLTPWYPPHIKPVRVGVYEVLVFNDFRCYQYWNGKYWGYRTSSRKEAFDVRSGESIFQHHRWRGLAHPPQSHNNPSSCEKK